MRGRGLADGLVPFTGCAQPAGQKEATARTKRRERSSQHGHSFYIERIRSVRVSLSPSGFWTLIEMGGIALTAAGTRTSTRRGECQRTTSAATPLMVNVQPGRSPSRR